MDEPPGDPRPFDEPAASSAARPSAFGERSRALPVWVVQRWIVAIVVTLAVLALDLSIPLGVAGGVPYVAVILLSLGLPGRRTPLYFGIACTALTGLGLLFSPQAGGTEAWMVLTNRGLALFAVWATVAVGLQRKRAERRLRRANAALRARGRELAVANEALRGQVAEHKRTTEALSLSTARTQAILEAAVDGIVSIDETGSIESLNPAITRIFGYTPEELVGQNVKILMPAPYREQHDAYLAAYRRTGIRKIIGRGREVVGLRKDGSTFPIELSVSEGYDGDRRFFTGMIHDISERKRAEEAEERARAAEQLASIGELTAGLAHEVGTPMNVILGYSQMLQESRLDATNRKRVAIITEQVERVASIVQTLMNFARPRETVRIPLELPEVLEKALSFVGEKFRRRGISVERRIDGVPAVRGDPEKLQQLFLNLFLNAADAMPHGGTLRLRAAARGSDGVEVEVRDSGSGMPPAVLEKIFEPFFTTKP
ncbi:MAG: PAS domain S-box protein, partial [Deltaproteobacteria bacterium]